MAHITEIWPFHETRKTESDSMGLSLSNIKMTPKTQRWLLCKESDSTHKALSSPNIELTPKTQTWPLDLGSADEVHHEPFWITIDTGLGTMYTTRHTDDPTPPQYGNAPAKGDSITARSCQRDVCCVNGCSKQRPKSGLETKTFFPFPWEETRFQQWRGFCGRQELMEKTPTQLYSEGFKICSDHFEDGQFKNSADPTTKRLVRDAVPTLLKKSRRPGPKMSKLDKTPKKKKTKLRVDVSSLTRTKGAGGTHVGHDTDCQSAEETPENEIKLEIHCGEDPALHWTTSQSVTEVSPEGGGDGETATTVQSLTAAAHIKVELMDGHTDPVPVHTPPPHTDWEPMNIKIEPQVIKAEPQVIKAEPQDTEAVQASPVLWYMMPKPLGIRLEPVFVEQPRARPGSVSHGFDNQTGSVVSSTDLHCDTRTGSLESFTGTLVCTCGTFSGRDELCIKKEPVDSDEHCL